jgi:lipoyl(octanoyl) transferase
MAPLPPLAVLALDPGSRTTPYGDAWDLQRRIHSEVVSGIRPDTLLLVEHDEVFTAGSRTQPVDRPDDGSPVIDVDRGGRITWHGPGQLVGYPIVRLPNRLDVVAYVRELESVLIEVCAAFGVVGERIDGRSGVWVRRGGPPAKVAAIGVRVARGVTMHGFALNCDCDLAWADRIVPCGIADAGVTSLTNESGRHVTVGQAVEAVHLALNRRSPHPLTTT